MPYRTFLFDLDGTLLDSVALIVASHRHTRRVHFGDDWPQARIIATMGRTLLDVYGEMAAAEGGDAAVMIATYRDWNLANHDRMVRAYPGVPEMLAELSQRGATLAVVTSKARALARRGLDVAGISGCFEVIVGGDDVERGKPDPLPVEAALEALGVEAGGAVMIGDSTHDMVAGRHARVATAAALWGPFGRDELARTAPDHWLTGASDVLDL